MSERRLFFYFMVLMVGALIVVVLVTEPDNDKLRTCTTRTVTTSHESKEIIEVTRTCR